MPEDPDSQGRLDHEQTSLKTLFYTFYLAGVGTWHDSVSRSEGKLRSQSVLSCHHMGPRDRTQCPVLAKGLSWMSHLSGPGADF